MCLKVLLSQLRSLVNRLWDTLLQEQGQLLRTGIDQLLTDEEVLDSSYASVCLSKFCPPVEIAFQAGHKLENRLTPVWFGFAELVLESVGGELVPVENGLLQGIIVVGLFWRHAGVDVESLPCQQGTQTGCPRVLRPLLTRSEALEPLDERVNVVLSLVELR